MASWLTLITYEIRYRKRDNMTTVQDNKTDLSMVMIRARHIPSSHGKAHDFGTLDFEFDANAHWTMSNKTSTTTVHLYLDSKEQAQEIIRLANKMINS